LRWVKSTLKDYSDIDLKDGYKSESFRNGKIFAGLINEFDDSMINYKALGKDVHCYADNCKTALETAENKMGIPAILEYSDLAAGKCNDKQLQLYLSLMYNAYKEKDLGMTKESLMRKVQELEEKVVLLTEENAALKIALQNAINAQNTLNETLSLTMEQHSKVRKVKDDLTTQYRELEEKFELDKARWEKELSELKAQKARLSENSDATTTQLQQEWEDMNAKRDAVRDELRKTREELMKEREELENAQKKFGQD